MRILNRSLLKETDKKRCEETASSPVTVLQIGEGNFLRGFVDWMIQVCRDQRLFEGSIVVVQPRPTGKPKIDTLAGQDGLYTLVTRGLVEGQPMERTETIAAFSQVFDPYTEWGRLIDLAVSPALAIVVSNTTEAGLAYAPEPLTDGPILSFPGKIAYLLYRRYQAFQGAADKGLLFLPCELLERNGDALRDAVLRYAADWQFPPAFSAWVTAHNRFLNSLVDRIVTGYPAEEQAETWFAEWGYRDAMLNTAEPYHLWAIEGEPELEALLPFRTAGLNVHWTDDLKSYQQRKLRILNGAHTWMAPLGLLYDVSYVRELLLHEELGAWVREAVSQEIIPTLPYPEAEMREYAGTVFERFENPYIRHRLADIAMNSLSKFTVRLLPSLASYVERGEPVPDRLVLGFAGLLRYYKIRRSEPGSYEGISLSGRPYEIRDNAAALNQIAVIWEEAADSGEAPVLTVRKLLSKETLWGRDLSSWQGVAEAVAQWLEKWDGGERK